MDARAYTSAVANGYVGGGRENPGKEGHWLLMHSNVELVRIVLT